MGDLHKRVRLLYLVFILLAARAGKAGGPAPEAAVAATVKLPDGPGSVAGLGKTIDVSLFSGQVHYEVPVDLPAGPAGFGPRLGLGYAGELGNGCAGVGWSLQHASIHRSTRHGVPTFSEHDELELTGIGEGGRLVRIGDGSYRIEGAGNALKIEASGSRFLITDADGTRYYMGWTELSRLEAAAGRVVEWRPELIVHLSGQSIAYDYLHHGGAMYLSQIQWGPDGMFRTVLSYEERPDPVISYRRGTREDTRLRLVRIAVESMGEELRSYHLAYQDDLPLSRLASVRMTGHQGQGELPVLSFSYAAPQPARLTRINDSQGWVLGSRGVTFFDVDGDGMEDLIRLEMGNHCYRKNLGSGFSEQRPLFGASGLELENVCFADLDGDARAELLRIVDDTWRASRLHEDTWETIGELANTRNLPFAGPNSALADLNGDGRTDVIRAAAAGVLVAFGTETGMSSTVFLPRISPTDAEVDPGADNVRFIDVNGDGLADVVWLTDAWMKIWLGRGDGTFEAWRRIFYPWGEGSFDLANLRLADLNRDGLLDAVLISAGHVLFHRGLADGSFESDPAVIARPAEAAFDAVVALADANGNGSADIVWSSPRGMWLFDLAGPTSAGMLSQIDNGLGKRISIEYEASARLAVEAEIAGTPWERKLPVSLPVPVASTVDMGDGSPLRRVSYGVRDGFWDASERRFGGFLQARQSVVSDSVSDISVKQIHHHAGIGDERVLRGRPWLVRLENGLGQLHTRTVTEWSAHPVGDLPDHPLLRVPVTTEVRTSHFEGQTEPIDTLARYVFDGQGRVTEEHRLGRLDLEGDESLLQRSYAVDDAQQWIRNRVCEEALFEQDGTLVSRTRTLYGATDGPPLPFGQIGSGLEREVLGWLCSEQRWIRLEATEAYSPNWNRLRTYAKGVTRFFTYDSQDLRPVSETVHPAEGQSLTWSMQWNQARGLAETLTDPDGVVTRLEHDALGRLTSMGLGTAPPTTRFEYDWTAPRPATTTFLFDGQESELGSWPGEKWRQVVHVFNGGGDPLFEATRLADADWIVTGTRQRDHKGRTIRMYDSFYWSGANVRAAAPAPETPVQTFVYDGYDRLVEQTLPNGSSRRTEYWAFGQQVHVDELEPVTSFFDGQSRIIRTQRSIDGVTESVEARYDVAGRILSMSLQEGGAEHVFSYDSLGRLVFATDPDIGDRHLVYDDRGFLIEHVNAAGQGINYGYDDIGRLTAIDADDGTAFAYHYDEALDPSDYRHTAGRLAWVEEPTGVVQLGYDRLGRQERLWRSIEDDQTGETDEAYEHVNRSPSGLILTVQHSDALGIEMEYDPAGRPMRLVGNLDGTDMELWRLEDQDAAGRVLSEVYGNGLQQTHQRDSLGHPARISIHDQSLDPLYRVDIERNAYTAPTVVDDTDSSGLDHSAHFAYDGAGRLTDASIGSSSSAYQFQYRYDGLQNMIRRQAQGPTSMGMFAGVYRYGEDGRGPRQLTSIRAEDNILVADFDYDPAGRQIRQNQAEMTYNGLDQLTRVDHTGPDGNGVVEHAYGYDGLRVITRNTEGEIQKWFTPDITDRQGRREHHIKLGDRIVARVTQVPVDEDRPRGVAAAGLHAGAIPLAAMAAVLLCLLLAGWRRSLHPHWLRVTATFAVVVLFHPGCTLPGATRQHGSPLWEHSEILYFHHGLSAGPVLITRADGTVYAERRYEPFGEDIDAYRQPEGGGESIGPVDFTREATNILNKQSDPDTGWSDHGARWMVPETARWLTPDPPVKAPDPKFMSEPWALHPYQYVNQNPVAFWDPDGHEKRKVRFVLNKNMVYEVMVSKVLHLHHNNLGKKGIYEGLTYGQLHVYSGIKRRGQIHPGWDTIAMSATIKYKVLEGAPHVPAGKPFPKISDPGKTHITIFQGPLGPAYGTALYSTTGRRADDHQIYATLGIFEIEARTNGPDKSFGFSFTYGTDSKPVLFYYSNIVRSNRKLGNKYDVGGAVGFTTGADAESASHYILGPTWGGRSSSVVGVGDSIDMSEAGTMVQGARKVFGKKR